MADLDTEMGAALRTVAEQGRRGGSGSSGAQVRRLAERRQTRHRALGATAAVAAVLLVCGAVAINHSTRAVAPAHRGTPSPSTPNPSPSPATAPALVPASALLTAADLPDAIVALSTAAPGAVRAAQRTAPDWTCAPAPSPGATARTAAFNGGSAAADTRIDQRVESFADVPAAVAATTAITERVTACAHSASAGTVDRADSETGVGDGLATVLTIALPADPSAHAAHVVWLETARTGRVVTWLSIEYSTQDSWPAQDIALRRAVERLCPLDGGGCVTEPVVRTTTYLRQLPADDPSTLTPALLAASLQGRWTATDNQDLGTPYACTGSVPGVSTPASSDVVRGWSTDLVDTYAPLIVRSSTDVGELIRPYGSAQAAQGVLTGLTNGFDHCGAPATQRVGSGLVWHQDAGAGRWWTMGRKDSSLVILEVRNNGAAGAYTSDQVSALLAAALAQLP
jgi:hypothetical protein